MHRPSVELDCFGLEGFRHHFKVFVYVFALRFFSVTLPRDVSGLWQEDLDDPSFRHRVEFGRKVPMYSFCRFRRAALHTSPCSLLADIARFRAPGWSWQNWISNKRFRSAVDEDDDIGGDGDMEDGVFDGSSRKKSAAAASGWQGWSK